MINGWKRKQLSEVATFYSGGTPSKSNACFWDGDIPWITVRDMKSIHLAESILTVTQQGASQIRTMPPGTIYVLVRGMGLFKDLPVLLCDREATFNQDIKAIVPNTGVDPEFLAFNIIARKSAILRLVDHAGHGTGRLDTDLLKSVTLHIPPMPTQRKIAALLRTWDEAIGKLEALDEASSKRLSGIAQRLYAPAQRVGREQKHGWRQRSFGAVFTERQDRNCGLGSDAVVTVGKYAIRKQSEHFNRSVASSDLSNYWTISPGEFVYDPMSAYYGALGQYTGDSDGIVSPAYRVIRLCNEVLPTFMVRLLKTHRIRFLLETRSSQGNKEGKRRLLPRDEFASIDFSLPPMEEQVRIAGILSAFEKDLAGTAELIEGVKRQKRGLMQKLLTGEWRVKTDGGKS